MSRPARVFHGIATAGLIALMLGALIFGLAQVHRALVKGLDNWPLSYEGTPEADAEMARNSAQGDHAWLLAGMAVAAGLTGVTGLAALNRVRWLAWAAGTLVVAILLVVPAGLA